MLKAILFDAAGTLIYLPESVGVHYARVARDFGVTLDPSALDQAFRRAWRAMPARAATADGAARPDDDKPWWRELVGRVLNDTLPAAEAGLGSDGFDCDGYFTAVYAHFAKPGVWAAFPEAVEVLAELHGQGLALGVVSNFDQRLRPVLADLGLARFFQSTILSSEVGADKPAARIFERALAELGVAAEETLHVGDDPERDWAATQWGLQVFELDRPNNDLRGALDSVAATRAAR